MTPIWNHHGRNQVWVAEANSGRTKYVQRAVQYPDGRTEGRQLRKTFKTSEAANAVAVELYNLGQVDISLTRPH